MATWCQDLGGKSLLGGPGWTAQLICCCSFSKKREVLMRERFLCTGFVTSIHPGVMAAGGLKVGLHW